MKRACHDSRQVGEERLAVDDVVVCSRLEGGERPFDVLRRDDNDWRGQSKATGLANEPGAAVIRSVVLDDRCRAIRVVSDPTYGIRGIANPCNGDRLSRLVEGCCQTIGEFAVLSDMKKFHEASGKCGHAGPHIVQSTSRLHHLVSSDSEGRGSASPAADQENAAKWFSFTELR